MSFPVSVIEALQQAGAAVFEADAQLKALAQEHARQVHEAVLGNPYHLGNDSLFEHWKTVARMSQTLSSMEQELRKLYQLAGDLAHEQVAAPAPVAVLAAPSEPAPLELVQALNVTDVRIKQQGRTARPRRAVRPRQSAGLPDAARRRPRRAATALRGNAARLLAYLQAHLNARSFSPLHQTAASKATGIPMGSMSAAMKKLLAERLIVGGPNGGYKFLG